MPVCMHGNASSQRWTETANHKGQTGQIKCEIAKELSPRRKSDKEGRKRRNVFPYFQPISELAGLCVTPKGLGQHQSPAWKHSVTMYTSPSLWFPYWKVFSFSSPCPLNLHHLVTGYTLPSLPLSAARCFRRHIWGIHQSMFSLFYHCKILE